MPANNVLAYSFIVQLASHQAELYFGADHGCRVAVGIIGHDDLRPHGEASAGTSPVKYASRY